jgi:hypothetical protein
MKRSETDNRPQACAMIVARPPGVPAGRQAFARFTPDDAAGILI